MSGDQHSDLAKPLPRMPIPVVNLPDLPEVGVGIAAQMLRILYVKWDFNLVPSTGYNLTRLQPLDHHGTLDWTNGAS